MHSDQDFELLLGGWLSLGIHQLGQLIGGAEAIGTVQTIGEGVVGSEIMLVAFLLARPVEELGGEGRVDLDFEQLGDDIGRDAAELVEIGDNGRAPAVVVLAEGVSDEAGNGGEAEGGGEEVVVRGRGRVSGRWGWGVWVPVLELERLGLGLGVGLGLALGDGDAVGKEATADGGAVLGGLAVAVEEVQLLMGLGDWGLRGHFWLPCCSLCLFHLLLLFPSLLRLHFPPLVFVIVSISPDPIVGSLVKACLGEPKKSPFEEFLRFEIFLLFLSILPHAY